MVFDWTLGIPLIAGGVRSICGFFENALKDGKIDSFEWGRLFGTAIEVGVISFAAMFGFGTDGLQSAGIGLLGSFIFSAMKKAGTK